MVRGLKERIRQLEEHVRVVEGVGEGLENRVKVVGVELEKARRQGGER